MRLMKEKRPKQARLSAADWLVVPANFGSIRSVLAARNITPGRMCKIAGGLTPRSLYDFLKKGSELRLLYVDALVRAFHTELTLEGIALEARETSAIRARPADV